MSRQLWCAHCGDEQKKLDGTRCVLKAIEAKDGDPRQPAEYERVIWGKARVPNPAERVMFLNNAPLGLPTEFYICDNCNRPIRPGDRCMTWAIWNEHMLPPPAWEKDFIE